MNETSFIERQIAQIRHGGCAVLFRMMKRLLRNLHKLPLYPLAVLPVLAIRLIRPWLLVRIGILRSNRIGHFAANTELYLCERDAGINLPKHRHVDLFYMGSALISNQQLASMWKRVLRVWPNWMLVPIERVNRLIPGSAVHEIDDKIAWDRDVHNLFEKYPSQSVPMRKRRAAPFCCIPMLVRDRSTFRRKYTRLVLISSRSAVESCTGLAVSARSISAKNVWLKPGRFWAAEIW